MAAHTLPQPPQLDVDENVASQPFESSASQLPWPWVQVTLHAPPAQLAVPFAELHAASLRHWPFVSQVCGVRPEHCRVPGAHAPAQAPALHTYWQVVSVKDP